MHNYDDLLQKTLNDLESGKPLDQVLQDLPEEASEIRALVRLAEAVRSVPHPEQVVEQVSRQRRMLIAAAQEQTRPIHRPKPSLLGWLAPLSVWGAATAAAVFIGLLLASLGLWLSVRSADSARVAHITGQVQVATNREATRWKNIATGERLREGQQLRTLGASSATLEFFEGTRSTVKANTQLVFEQMDGGPGKSLQVEILQQAGETWHQVSPLQGSQSFFLIRTPAGTASVHGTQFAVRVVDGGQTQFAVNTGEVRVAHNAETITLLAGQVTTAAPSGILVAPAFSFQVQGSVLEIDQGANLWTVSGVTFQVNEQTRVKGSPALGETVRASGYIQANGVYAAAFIDETEEEEIGASFTGTLEQKEGDVWVVNKTGVLVNEQTYRSIEPRVGDPVEVTFNVLEDGTWLALSVTSLVENPGQPRGLPNPTVDPDADPEFRIAPSSAEESACGTDGFNIVGTLSNTAGESKDYGENVRLEYEIDNGGEYVERIMLYPNSIKRLEAGQEISFVTRVSLNQAWSSAPKGVEIRLRVFIASASKRPDHRSAPLVITIRSDCPNESTQEANKAVLPEKTKDAAGPKTEPKPEETGAQPLNEPWTCTGTDPHPTGMKLAQRYGVSYDEIMQWFCSNHYGLGEIDLVYNLSRQANPPTPVEEIFALRASGISWGEIKQQVTGMDKQDQQNNGKNDNPPADLDGDGDIDENDRKIQREKNKKQP